MRETGTDLEKLCEEYGHPMNAAAAMTGKVICNAAGRCKKGPGELCHGEPRHEAEESCARETCPYSDEPVECIPVEETP